MLIWMRVTGKTDGDDLTERALQDKRENAAKYKQHNMVSACNDMLAKIEAGILAPITGEEDE